ncbi:helix-turn-helix domain-containing protein [Undibacterium sp.]|uniref:TetR/AcrR family transcriptional regulator n=1 Tax=Undibacterium sp. TaxID=1914977 RepID=UPI002C3E313A|nr:helix-turn-helix domain-containing protein [Undibacterium sp.]HTD06473.1 helix-turn-helix domain-containing protein [Undibacterium sp.]
MTTPAFLSDAAGHDPGRRERKRRQTVDHLAGHAFRLFEAQGYDAVTMEQIAAEADVSKGTLYNHFPVKEALLAHQFHLELAADMPRMLAAMQAEPDFAGRVRCWLHASADWSENRRGYLPHYLRFRFASLNRSEAGADQKPARSGLDQLFDALIRAAQDAGELRPEFPSAQLAQMLQFLYLGAVMRWLAVPGIQLRAEFDAVLDVFLHGLVALRTGSCAGSRAESRTGSRT